MAAVSNQAISYDEHGAIPLDLPFRQLAPRDISLYLQLDTTVGKKTCRQACAHCFYINQPQAAKRSIDLHEGRRIMDDLMGQGYRVFPMIADSFGAGGAFLRLFGNTHNRDFHQEHDCKPTKTMQRGDMWTSGAPLLDPDWRDYLWTGIENGFGNVTITFHGVPDEHLKLAPADTYPIKGVFAGADCERVMARIHAFNDDLRTGRLGTHAGIAASLLEPLSINLGVTIGKHNHTREHLLRYVHYFKPWRIAVLRFNAFHDHGWHLPQLPLSRDEIAQWYRDLKWVHQHIALDFQLAVDEDFGSSGIEAMDFPAHIGWCRAGHQLFAIVPERPQALARGHFGRRERIGSIAACVDAFEPVVGDLIRETPCVGTVSYRLAFFDDVIDGLMRKRRDGTYTDGCFAPDMLNERKSAQ